MRAHEIHEKISKEMIKKTAILILYALLNLHSLLGQETNSDLFAFVVLNITPDARSHSLGNTVAIGDQWNSGYWNPAGVGFTRGMALQYDHVGYFAGISSHNWTAGYTHKKFGSLAFTYRRVSFGSIKKTTEEFPEGGIGSYEPHDDVIALNYAFKIFDMVSFGVTIKRFSSQIDKISAEATLYDLGVMAKVPIGRVLGCNNILYIGTSTGNNLIGSNPKYHGNGSLVIDSQNVFFSFTSIAFLVERNYRMGIGHGFSYTNKNILNGSAEVFEIVNHFSYQDFSTTNVFVSDHSYKSEREELIFGTEINMLEIASVRFSSKNFIRGNGKVWGERYGFGIQLPSRLFMKSHYEITPKFEYSEQRMGALGDINRWSFGIDVKL
ncbi:hypothetical protein JNL27_11150 [bacterium]|nr:hypothetical protein [bacterium]